MPENPATISAAVEDEAVEICCKLIQIDSSNYGDGSGPGEREAAEYVLSLMTEVGLEPTFIESEPRRSNIVVRVPGTDSTLPALVVHGHTDVVPADPAQWTVDPFSGEIRDGMIWGRGAVDMKNMDAMILAVLRNMIRSGRKPRRDLIFAFFADEEAGGKFGSGWMVENHPELFAGATEAISEVGGYSVTVAGQRAYLIQTAEKSLAWIRLISEGTAGHGSQVNHDNAVAKLAKALARIGEYEWPQRIAPSVDELFRGVAELANISYAPDDPGSIDEVLDALGPVAKFVGATVSSRVNPTQLSAGYKANVVPGSAEAVIDVRSLPGDDDDVIATIKDLAGPGVKLEFIHRDIGLEADFAGDLIDAMIAALEAEDPGAKVWPYMLSGGTDNKALSRLGITGYGFAPLQLPPELDFAGMFHGVDERVPVAAVRFGTRVLARFLDGC